MTTELRTYAFVLAVPDLPKAAAYFQSALGFKTDWVDGDNWHTLSRDGVRVMMGHCPDQIPPEDLGDHNFFGYMHVDDVNALYAEWSKTGAIIRKPPADKPWGLREMAVGLPDGHRFMVAQVLGRAS